jgi:hypothetical protein
VGCHLQRTSLDSMTWQDHCSVMRHQCVPTLALLLSKDTHSCVGADEGHIQAGYGRWVWPVALHCVGDGSLCNGWQRTVEYYLSVSAAVAPLLPLFSSTELVDYIYATLGLNLDYVTPFATFPENGRCAGRKIESLDVKSKLAHRIVLLTFCIPSVLSRLRRRAVKLLPTLQKLSSRYHLITAVWQWRAYSGSKISVEMPFNHRFSES